MIWGGPKKVNLVLDHIEKWGFLHDVQHVLNNIYEVFLNIANFDHFCCISWEFSENQNFKLLKMEQN